MLATLCGDLMQRSYAAISAAEISCASRYPANVAAPLCLIPTGRLASGRSVIKPVPEAGVRLTSQAPRPVQGLAVFSMSASLQLGEQTNCALPSKRLDFSRLLGLCLPHRKHDIVAAPNAPAAVNGDPGVLLR